MTEKLRKSLKGREDPYYTEELASLLGITYQTLFRRRKAGQIVAVEDPLDSRKLIYPVANVRAYLEKRQKLSRSAS
mgnify:CR=1 FL=1|tara:strand:- start:1919 stop:2146 length:228 start_codon:yes stop_codon:yes gene_type:complete